MTLMSRDLRQQQSSIQSTQTTSIIDNHRRTLLVSLLSLHQLSFYFQPTPSHAAQGILDPQLQNYFNPALPNWKGTALPGPLSISEAYSQLILPSLFTAEEERRAKPIATLQVTTTTFPMGRWPDPILRKPASSIPHSLFHDKYQIQQLRLVAKTLQNTARHEGAVGLAAQQCGIDASLIYIDVGEYNHRSLQRQQQQGGREPPTMEKKQQRRTSSSQKKKESNEGIFLVNPRIVHRSQESEMLVWTEECLVLPPEFKATLLRDAEVTIEYETLCLDDDDDDHRDHGSCGETKQITFRGELARCAQHEIDHDKGILIVDHVGLEELLCINGQTLMEDVENSDELHAERMQRAYERVVYDSSLLPSTGTNVALARDDVIAFFATNEDVESGDGLVRNTMSRRPWFVQSAIAMEDTPENNSIQISITASSRNAEKNSSQSDRPDSAARSCDYECHEERKRRIQQRRAMMEQSRSLKNRGDVLELSRQRALLYGTVYKGLFPSACSSPGFCP